MNQPKKTKSAESEKDKKSKLVRDSFTIPKDEYAAIDALKSRALAMGVAIKKSELLRAGLMALASMEDDSLKAALAAVPTLKTGRPSNKAEVVAEVAEASAQPETATRPDPVATEAAKPARKPRKPRAKVESAGSVQ